MLIETLKNGNTTLEIHSDDNPILPAHGITWALCFVSMVAMIWATSIPMN